MESNRVKLENRIKKLQLYLIPILLLAVIIALCIVSGYEKSKQPLPEPVKIINAGNSEVYASVSVQMLTDPFASDDENEYHFAVDKDNYMCIVVLNNNDAARLKQIMDYTYSEGDVTVPDAITITGRTQSIESDLKEIAIDSYNEMIEDDLLNEENFEDYMGNIYLDTKLSPISYYTETVIVACALIFEVILLVCYFNAVIKTKSTLKKYTLNGSLEYIYSQLDQLDTLIFLNGKTFLTREYVVDVSDGLTIFKYDDIKWIYPAKLTQYGITVGRYIKVINIDNKQFTLFSINGFSKKNKLEEFEKAYFEICKRSPNALNGYTAENINRSKRN